MIHQKKILLLGDSITEAFNTDELLPDLNLINKGVYGESTTELIERLKNNYINFVFDIVFVLIGTNDLVRDRSNEQICSNFEIIINQLSKINSNAKIYITSILPTRELENRPNSRIDKLNLMLENLAANNGVNFFPLNRYFKDASNNLKKELTEDGLHLNYSGYQVWAMALKEFLLG